MKKLLLFVSLLVGLGSSFAQDIVVQTSSGGQTSVPLDNVRKITFDNGNMVLSTNGNEDFELPLDDIMKILFDKDGSNVDRIVADTNLHLVRNSRNTIGITGLETAADARIVNTVGSIVMIQRQWNGSDIDISALPSGVYVLVVGNNNIFKFSK